MLLFLYVLLSYISVTLLVYFLHYKDICVISDEQDEIFTGLVIMTSPIMFPVLLAFVTAQLIGFVVAIPLKKNNS